MILVLYKVPNGVSMAKPPALVTPPAVVWHTAQSPAAASRRPRSRVAADQLPGAAGVTGAISARQGSAVVSRPKVAPSRPPSSHLLRFFLVALAACSVSGVAFALRAARTRSAVIGNSRKRRPVAS
ncbi:hypothetical protein D3C77_609910 [compost metagenome]